MEFTDKYYKEIMDRVRISNLLLEISYEGNVGFSEVMEFYKIATPEQVSEFEEMLESNDLKNAWEMIQSVTGVRLVGLDNNI
jgi:hypothetical protein